MTAFNYSLADYLPRDATRRSVSQSWVTVAWLSKLKEQRGSGRACGRSRSLRPSRIFNPEDIDKPLFIILSQNYSHDSPSPTRSTFALTQGLASHCPFAYAARDFASSLCNGLFPKLGRELL